MGLGRVGEPAGREGTSQRMGFFDRGMGRAASGALASFYFRQASPASPDSPPGHSQAMILGGVGPDFLLFGGPKGRAKRGAMYVRSVPSASAVFAPKCLLAIFEREER